MFPRVELSEAAAEVKVPDLDITALSEALDRLQDKDFRAAELAKLRIFAGLTREQAAAGWLKAELASATPHPENMKPLYLRP